MIQDSDVECSSLDQGADQGRGKVDKPNQRRRRRLVSSNTSDRCNETASNFYLAVRIPTILPGRKHIPGACIVGTKIDLRRDSPRRWGGDGGFRRICAPCSLEKT
jgi:hypothetical protein